MATLHDTCARGKCAPDPHRPGVRCQRVSIEGLKLCKAAML
jgi:hypothetical protein